MKGAGGETNPKSGPSGENGSATPTNVDCLLAHLEREVAAGRSPSIALTLSLTCAYDPDTFTCAAARTELCHLPHPWSRLQRIATYVPGASQIA